jgi:outer membrane receptor for ferric coprogen and ferric-rhodotorulic acid
MFSIPFRFHPICSAVMLICASQLHAPLAKAQDLPNPKSKPLPEITVNADVEEISERSRSYTVRKSASASKLDLSLRETPQSVSVVTRAKMDDFQLSNANALLSNTPGVTVENFETDRTYYTARGFDITNFQYDGVGLPFDLGLANGDIDTAIFDRVEIVRGANGLMSATGNPSATVNFIRKRPTYPFQARGSLTYGSWNNRRVDADVSGALNADASVAARLVVVNASANSYLDRYTPKKNVVYVVIEANLSDDSLLSVGHTYQANAVKGGMWGSNPLYYTDGSATDFKTSTSTSANWSKWDTWQERSFVEYKQKINADWHAKINVNYHQDRNDAKLLYVYGVPDKATGIGLLAYPSLYQGKSRQTMLDANFSGSFNWLGRSHQLVFGADWSQIRFKDASHYGQGIGNDIGSSLTTWRGNYPEPLFDAGTEGSDYREIRKSLYATARFHLSDATKLISGAKWVKVETTGESYGASHVSALQDTTPYVGVIHDLFPDLSIYAGYSSILNPQSQTDIQGKKLTAVEGTSAEFGGKAELFNRQLNLAASVFKISQNNVAEQAGMLGNKPYYRGINANSQGIELEASGEVATGWNANLGYTQQRITDQTGKAARTYLPRRTMRLSTTYQVDSIPALKVGAALNWQSDISRDQGEGIVSRQASYAVLNMMAQYQLSPKAWLALNLNNVRNQKYLTSLYTTQAFYAAPRHASLNLTLAY